MVKLVREMLHFCKPKIWMWGIITALSGIITYAVTTYSDMEVSHQMFMKYPFLFLYIVLFYLSLVLGFLLMTITVLLFRHIYQELKGFQENFPEMESTGSGVVKILKSKQPPPKFFKSYQEDLLYLFTGNEETSEEVILSDESEGLNFLPFSINYLESQYFPEILNDLNFSTRQAMNEIRKSLLLRLHQELQTNFLQSYLEEQTDTQILYLLLEDPDFTNDTLAKIQYFSNLFEFTLRVFSYLLADWCIDVYARKYGVNKNIFYTCDSNTEYENIVGKLNSFKNSLLGSNTDVSHIITYRFSVKSGEFKSIKGELFDIYQNCSSMLKQ